MASEKNPSIYDDRSAIGSSEELDEYGVWVKSGPQDIPGGLEGEDFSPEDTSDEEGADISLDLPEDFSIPAQDELPDFEDFPVVEETEDFTIPDDADFNSGDLSFATSEIDDISGSDISFETIETGNTGEADESINIDIPLETETDETIDFSPFLENESDTQDSGLSPASAGEISFEESSPGGEEDLNFADFKDFGVEAEGEDPLLGGTPEESTTEIALEEPGNDYEISFEENADFPEIPEKAPLRDFPAEKPVPAAVEAEDAHISTKLLLQIANELSAIKTELSSLKKEINAVKGEIPLVEHTETAQVPGGFFDEADDEKIALTGAEMDNILHTASFTEETETAGLDDAVLEEPLTEPDAPAEPEPIDVEIDMDEFGPEPVITPLEEEPDISEEIGALPDDFAVSLEADLSVPEFPAVSEESPAEGIALPETDDLAIDLSEDISDLDLDANLSLDFPLEDGETAAESSDSSIDDSFAQLIPEGFVEKSSEPALPGEDALEEDDILDSEILLEDEAPDTKLQEEDIPAFDADESIDLDSTFELSPGLEEDAIDTGIPEVSLDLSAEFDAIGLSDDLAEEPVELDLTEEPVEFDLPEETETLDIPAPADSEAFFEDISIDLPLESSDELAAEFSIDEESLPAEFSVETPEEASIVEPAPEEPLDLPEPPAVPPAKAAPQTDTPGPQSGVLANVPVKIREELKTVLTYMDQLLESLPEEKIEEFAKSEYFDTYKKLFEDLGLV